MEISGPQRQRRDQAAFNRAVADERRRRRQLNVRDQGETHGPAVVAEQVDLGPQEDIAKAGAVLKIRHGAAVEHLRILQAVELDLDVHPVGHTQLERRIKRLIVARRHAEIFGVGKVDQIGFDLEMAGVDRSD